jgi:hypothetical protein
MNRDGMISQLDKATDKAASIAIRESMPIPSKKGVFVGSVFIEKNSKGFYDVLSIGGKLLYPDIAVFDVAIIVAQRHSNEEHSVIKKVLDLEEVYSKNHTEMLYFLHCYKGAKKKRDYSRMAILEDKFSTSEARAKVARDRISFFKRMK